MLIRPASHDVDLLAANLHTWGKVARAMPPTWRSHRRSMPIVMEGRQIGRMLPGRGIALTTDLKTLGITKPIPGVIERTVLRRALDLLLDEDGAITTYDGIIAARATGKKRDVILSKASLSTAGVAWASLFGTSGVPNAGSYASIPGGATFNKSDAGALSWAFSNPTGGDRFYLITFGFTASNQLNSAILADLLLGAGGISTNTSSPQTVNSTALTRYTDGVGVMMTFEVTTIFGAGAANISATYTNSAGASRTMPSSSLTQNAIVGRLQPVALGPLAPLQGDDLGVRSVETVTVSAAMGGGAIALNLYVPLLFQVGVAANVYMERDSTTQIDGIIELTTDSGGNLGHLVAYVLPNSTSTGVVSGFIRSVWG